MTARGYVEDNMKDIPEESSTNASSECRMGDKTRLAEGILKHMTVKENIEKNEVANIITDLFIAAADTVSIVQCTFVNFLSSLFI